MIRRSADFMLSNQGGAVIRKRENTTAPFSHFIAEIPDEDESSCHTALAY